MDTYSQVYQTKYIYILDITSYHGGLGANTYDIINIDR